jgi:hypothetical protein
MATLLSPNVTKALDAAEATLHWAAATVDGKTIPPLENERDVKRARLSAMLWHLGLEHSMSIVLLVRETMFGSALALLRVASEAHVRGLWVSRAAKDRGIDNAADDKFPPFASMVEALERELGPDALAAMKGDTWRRLNDYTHSGAQQMLARFTAEGNIGDNYTEEEKLSAVGAADVLMHSCAIHLLALAGEQALHDQAVQRLHAKQGASQ